MNVARASRPPTRVSALTITGIALASALVPLNSTMIAVALPRIARHFAVSKGHAGVLITVYLAAMLIGQPVAGRIVDAIGARRLTVIAVAGFGVCSAAAIAAPSFLVLVLLRVGQALFASALAPSVQAMLRAITPPTDRGRAYGLLGSVIGVGAGLGPVIGGLATSAFGWRSIFGVNLPIVVVVLVVLRRVVPLDGDVTSSPTAGEPAADGRLVNPVFVSAFSAQALATLAQYSLLLIVPIVLDDRGWRPGAIGVAMSLLTLGMVLMGPPGGRLSDRRGRRVPVLFGLALALVAVTGSAVFGDDVASAMLLATMLLFGLGLGMATPSIMAAGLESAPHHRVGLGSGLFSASRYVGSIVASVLLTALVTDGGSGTGVMLIVSVGALLVSLATAVKLPSRPQPGDTTLSGRPSLQPSPLGPPPVAAP
jgi:DHA2 family methylenomycin A resistance protein-like MFS transporter